MLLKKSLNQVRINHDIFCGSLKTKQQIVQILDVSSFRVFGEAKKSKSVSSLISLEVPEVC